MVDNSRLEDLFSSLNLSTFSKLSVMNLMPLKPNQCNNSNRTNKTCEKHPHMARLPTPYSREASHPWTIPPVNPRCSEKDSCNGMKDNSVGGGGSGAGREVGDGQKSAAQHHASDPSHQCSVPAHSGSEATDVNYSSSIPPMYVPSPCFSNEGKVVMI